MCVKGWITAPASIVAWRITQCPPLLLRQIELVQPRLIRAMGRFAVQALLRTSEPIGRLRRKAHRCQGVPLVASCHPAYLLRNLPDKARGDAFEGRASKGPPRRQPMRGGRRLSTRRTHPPHRPAAAGRGEHSAAAAGVDGRSGGKDP
jgi:hypothetical protein